MFRADLLAQNIKNCRMKMGLTQSELAEKLFVSGQTISKWESGQSVPDIDNLCMLSELFSTSVDKLIGNAAGITNGKTFIGIDGDGTNTEFVLFTENGDIIYSEYFKENNLEVKETIVPISARLIANKSSYKFKRARIDRLVQEL